MERFILSLVDAKEKGKRYRRILPMILVLAMMWNMLSAGQYVYATESLDTEESIGATVEENTNDGEDDFFLDDTSDGNGLFPGEVVIADEEVTDEEATDEEVTDEEVTDEEATDEEVTDEEVTDEEVTDEEVTDEEVTDEEATDEEVTDEEVTDEETTEGSLEESPVVEEDALALDGLEILMDEMLEVVLASDVATAYGSASVTMPDDTGATYTLRIALTRHTLDKEQIALNNEEDYYVLVSYEDGEMETRAMALSPSTVWGALAGQISDIPAGATVTIENILVSTGDGDTWGDYVNTFLYFEVVSSDANENVILENPSQELVENVTVNFVIQSNDEAVGGTYVTEDTFEDRSEPYSSANGEYSLLYILNNYNVVSFKDIEATHIVGPIIAQEGAYRTGDSYTGANHDGSDLVASDYSRGVSSYVGKLYSLEGDANASALQLGYGFDDDDPDFVPPHFYTRETEIDGDGFIVVTDVTEGWEIFQYIHVSRFNGTFRSPNAHGVVDNYDAAGVLQREKTYTYQNDDFIDFKELWDTLTEESYELMETGSLEGETEVITINSAGTYLEIEAGKSYLIKDATYLETVNIILPDDYDFFVNPYLPPTTISFEGSTINPAIYDGLLVSQFPETLINGEALDALEGEGGEYSEVGNKIIWNMPNVVTTGNSNRLVTFGEGVNIAGHIVAVNAEFWNINAFGAWEGGNLNGAAVVKDFHSGNMEMHMWAYGGLLEQATYVKLLAEKTFRNGDLSANSFLFKLSSQDDDTVLYASSDEEGMAYFSSLVFEEAGTYTYFISEVIPEDEGNITYDKSVYQVDITVTVNKGTDDNGYVYVNYSNKVTYTKIQDSDGNTLETGEKVTSMGFINSQSELEDGETVSYTFTKVDGTGRVLSGASFIVITAIDPSSDDKAWDAENSSDTQTSGAGGAVTFANLAPDTTYYFKETVAPSGYDLAEGYWKIYVDDYGGITVTAMGGAAEIVDKQLVNYLSDTSLVTVKLTKADQYGGSLAGAVFLVERVFSIDDLVVVEGSYSKTFTSDENGLMMISDLSLDRVYKVTELVAPDGYMLPFDINYWLIEILTDEETEAGYTITLYSVDVDGTKTIITKLDNGYTLINWSVYILPSTGGEGLYLYYIVGLILMSTTVLWYPKLKREKNRRKL